MKAGAILTMSARQTGHNGLVLIISENKSLNSKLKPPITIYKRDQIYPLSI